MPREADFQVAAARLKSRLALPPMRTVAAADSGAMGMVLHPSFGFHGSAVNGGTAIGTSDPAIMRTGASAPPPVHIVGQTWKMSGNRWISVADAAFHPIVSGVGSMQSIATAAAATTTAAITSFTQAQWDALNAALANSLGKDSGGTGHIFAPGSGVQFNFLSALASSGAFSAAELAAIQSSIAGSTSGHVDASSSTISARLEAALHNTFTMGNPIAPIPIVPNPIVAPPSDTSGLTSSLLGLGSSSGLSGGSDTSPVPVTPAFPTTSSGPSIGIVIGLVVVAAFGIYMFAKHKHKKEHAAK